jgi:hypothetical protein
MGGPDFEQFKRVYAFVVASGAIIHHVRSWRAALARHCFSDAVE